MPYNVYLGIDPGKDGGIVALSPDGDVLDSLHLDRTAGEVYRWLLPFGNTDEWNAFAYLEKVGGYIPGSKGNQASQMFEFGRSFGWCEMALAAVNLPFELIRPQEWQPEVGMAPRPKGMPKKKWKQALVKHAKLLFKMDVRTWEADALLLAEVCRADHEEDCDEC